MTRSAAQPDDRLEHRRRGRGSASAIRPCSSVSRTTARSAPAPGTATPWPARRAARGRAAPRAGSPAPRPARRPARDRRRPPSNGPIRGAPQLLAVGVAEVGDQAAHVGARASTRSRNAAPLAVAPALVEAVDLDLALGQLDASPGARQRVGAPAADLDRRVGRRALAHAARRAASGRPPGTRPVCGDLALGIAGGRDRAEPRGRPRRSWAAPSGSAGRAWRGRPAPAAGRWRTDRACPAWPTFGPAARCTPSARRIRATTSCEVIPAGLS